MCATARAVHGVSSIMWTGDTIMGLMSISHKAEYNYQYLISPPPPTPHPPFRANQIFVGTTNNSKLDNNNKSHLAAAVTACAVQNCLPRWTEPLIMCADVANVFTHVSPRTH